MGGGSVGDMAQVRIPPCSGTGRGDEAGAGPCQVSVNIVEVKYFGFGEEERNLASSLHRWLSADSAAPAGMAKNNQGSALPLWCWDINFATSKQPGNRARRQLLRAGLWAQFLSSHPPFPLSNPDLSRKRVPRHLEGQPSSQGCPDPPNTSAASPEFPGHALWYYCSANPPLAA